MFVAGVQALRQRAVRLRNACPSRRDDIARLAIRQEDEDLQRQQRVVDFGAIGVEDVAELDQRAEVLPEGFNLLLIIRASGGSKSYRRGLAGGFAPA